MASEASLERKAFVSYAWESDEHRDWVRRFAEVLITNGVDTTLDQFELNPGDDLYDFMISAVRDNSYVFCICTPKYVRRANELAPGTGVAVETKLLIPRFFEGDKQKLIPVLRSTASGLKPMPDYLGNLKYLDFRRDADFSTSMDELLRFVYGVRKHKKPHTGSPPDFGRVASRMPLDLSLSRWQGTRARKRGNAPLVPTSTSERLVARFTAGHPAYVLLDGKIASGKSSIAEQVGLAFRDHHADSQVVVLPLASDFPRPNNAPQPQACEAFAALVASTNTANAGPILLVIEDAHEGQGNKQYEWAVPVDPVGELSILVTTRSYASAEVEKRMRDAWKIQPETESTDPVEAAKEIIGDRVSSWGLAEPRSEELKNELAEHFEGFMGMDLVMLEACLDRLKDEPQSVISRDLAFDTVDAELADVLRTAGFHDIESRLVVLMTWCFGGLELPLTFDVLEADLGLRRFSDVLKLLEDRNEIQTDRRNRHRSLRHPAWGRLAINALRYSRRLTGLRREIADRLREQYKDKLPPEQLDEVLSDPLASILLVSLFCKAAAIDDLSFYCAAQYFSMPFARAALAYVAAQKKQGEYDLESAEALMQVANNLRRSNFASRKEVSRAQAWQLNLREGWEHLSSAVEIRKQHYGEELEEDPRRGAILYELGYYANLKGDFEGALAHYKESKATEKRRVAAGQSERRPFCAMSAVQESITLVYLNRLEEARAAVDEAQADLDACTEPEVQQRAQRFRGNAWHATFEIAMRRGAADEATECIAPFMEAYRAGRLSTSHQLYFARVHLLKAEIEQAMKLISQLHHNEDLMGSAEGYVQVCRITADSQWLQGQQDEALNAYRQLLPPDDGGERWLNHELKMIEARCASISQGGDDVHHSWHF